MRKVLKKYVEAHWWAFFIQSLVALGLGAAALFMPGITMSFAVFVIALGLIAMGLVELVRVFCSIKEKRGLGLSLLVAIFQFGIGGFLLWNPEIGFDLLTIILAAWLIVRGVMDMVIGFTALADGVDKYIWSVAGIAGVVVGIVILNYPYKTGLTLVSLLGAYALVFGLVNIFYALRARSILKKATSEEKKSGAKKKAKK